MPNASFNQQADKSMKTSPLGVGMKEIRKEIEVLESKLKAKREEYQLLSNELIAVENQVGNDYTSPYCAYSCSSFIPHCPLDVFQFRIKQSLRLLPDEASYLLSLEIDIPIDLVALKCDVPLLLLEQPGSPAICSISPPSKHSKDQLLATFKCHTESNRVDIKVSHWLASYGRAADHGCAAVPHRGRSARRDHAVRSVQAVSKDEPECVDIVEASLAS